MVLCLEVITLERSLTLTLLLRSTRRLINTAERSRPWRSGTTGGITSWKHWKRHYEGLEKIPESFGVPIKPCTQIPYIRNNKISNLFSWFWDKYKTFLLFFPGFVAFWIQWFGRYNGLGFEVWGLAWYQRFEGLSTPCAWPEDYDPVTKCVPFSTCLHNTPL